MDLGRTMDRFRLPTVLPVLRGRRLDLRSMDERDAAALLDIYGDPLVMRYTDEDPFPDLATIGAMLGSVRSLLATGESLEWAIVLHEGEVLVGTCGLHSFDQMADAAEVGCLLRRSAWGAGYMTEAVGLLAGFARDELRLRRLRADVAPENARAQGLFKRLGYRRTRSGMLGIDLSSTVRAA